MTEPLPPGRYEATIYLGPYVIRGIAQLRQAGEGDNKPERLTNNRTGRPTSRYRVVECNSDCASLIGTDTPPTPGTVFLSASEAAAALRVTRPAISYAVTNSGGWIRGVRLEKLLTGSTTVPETPKNEGQPDILHG